MRVNLLGWVILGVMLASSVSAFGISYQYMKDNTLELNPGQEYLFSLEVQNKEEEDIRVAITVDSAIAAIQGDPEIDVPAKSYDRYYSIMIKIPEDAVIGAIYPVNYLVYPVVKGEGQVPLSVRYKRSFSVKVVEKPLETVEESPTAFVTKKTTDFMGGIGEVPLIVGVCILVVVLFIVIWRKSSQFSGGIFGKRGEEDALSVEMTSTDSIDTQGVEEEPVIDTIEDNYEMPLAKPKENMQKEHERELPREEYFHLREGKNLRNLHELCEEISHMDDRTFSHYVNSTKNDFSRWIYHLGKRSLAKEVAKTTDRNEMHRIIKNELEEE